MQPMSQVYDPDCRRCPRLASFLDQVRHKHPSYFCRPVPPFGDPRAALLVVGLAPGMHGANATGRPFTGDACSDLLYGSLYDQGFSTGPRSVHANDDLKMMNCRVTNAVKCLPPDNKPLPMEASSCRPFLQAEITAIAPRVILCLGALSHDAVVRCFDLKRLGVKRADLAFAHGAEHRLDACTIIDSYHPSRYNINTGRLTEAMFKAVVARARVLVDAAAH
nr:Type-5 uracil-DNA glycosylase [Cupriavidus sp.]